MKIDNKYIHSLRQLAEAMDLITLLICELIKIILFCQIKKIKEFNFPFLTTNNSPYLCTPFNTLHDLF